MVTDGIHRSGDGDRGKGCAAVKGIITNFRNGGGNKNRDDA